MKMDSINDLCKRAYDNSVKHGFYENEKGFGDVIALMHSELTEAYEEYRHLKEKMDYNEKRPYKHGGKLN